MHSLCHPAGLDVQAKSCNSRVRPLIGRGSFMYVITLGNVSCRLRLVICAGRYYKQHLLEIRTTTYFASSIGQWGSSPRSVSWKVVLCELSRAPTLTPC